MKISLILLFLCSINCLAQPKDAKFTVIAIKNSETQGVHMTINLKAEHRPAPDQTVGYALMDHQEKLILFSMSDKEGVINLHIYNFKYIKYVYIGGPGDEMTRIDLTQFIGKQVVLELEVKPDLKPLND